MWRSFKQALDLDMGAQMASGAIDPETSLWLMISRRTACGIHTRLICSPPTCRSTLQRTSWGTIAMTSHIYTHLSVDAFAEASLKVINFQHAQQRKKKRNPSETGDTSNSRK